MPDLLPCFLLAAGGVTQVMGLLSLVLVLMKLRQSLLIGYFACGVAAANSGLLQWLGGESFEGMTVLADTSVTLLMFTLGIEFSLSELKHLRKAALLGGGLQVALTGGSTAGLALAFGMTGPQAAVLAVAIALGSTAVSMRTFQELSMPASPAARASLGIAIFQDLLVIAFMLLLPMILSEEGSEGRWLLVTGELVLLFAAIAWVLGKYLIPRLLLSVSRTQSRELFTLTVLALCVSVACLASLMGLSPALGAFVAGLVVSGSIYSHRVLADILPFKDLFADATHRETWDLARVPSARLVAFTFPDAVGAINSLAHLREQAPNVPVIARVKFAADADALRDAGATRVVFDEVENAAAAVRAAREEFEIAVE